jgi:hypothetical protein
MEEAMGKQPTAQQLIAYGRLLRELHSAGFSRRAASVLALSDQFAKLGDLRFQHWFDDADGPGLRTRLLRTPGCGPAVIAELEAYREHGDPRKQGPHPIKVTVELDAQAAQALDAWISGLQTPMSRAEALRTILAEGLTSARKTRLKTLSSVPAN